MSELVQSNLTIGIHNRHMNLFKKSPFYLDEIESRIITLNDKKIKQILDTKSTKYAILLRETDGKRIYRNMANIIDEVPLYHIMRDCPVPCSMVYGLRYGSPYLPRINVILRHLSEAGILEYWTRSEDHTLNNKHNKALYVGNSHERKPFTMNNLKEIFYVWLSGVVISVFVFLVEHVVHFINRIALVII